MKNLIFTGLLTAIGLMPAIALHAQRASNPYWVVETHTQGPARSIIRIYDANDRLIAEETMKGKRLDTTRKAVRRKLDRMAAGASAGALAVTYGDKEKHR